MNPKSKEKLCLRETNYSVTSVSTVDYVPQPIDEKSHFIRNRIFVGNFPCSATHKDISNAFRPFGEIIETNIIDTPSCNSRYGFVTFQSIASADAVLSLYFRGREFIIKGQALNINRALFKPKRQINGKLTRLDSPINNRAVMVMGGHTVLAEFVNGMAYFRPMKEQYSPYVQEQRSIVSKNFSRIAYPPLPLPIYCLSSQYRFQSPFQMQHGLQLQAHQYPASSNMINIRQFHSQIPVNCHLPRFPATPGSIIGPPQYGTVPVIR